MKKIRFNYLDVRRLESVFTYFVQKRLKEVDKDKIKSEMEIQQRFWLVLEEMRKALKDNKKLYLVLTDEDPQLHCKRCTHSWLPRSNHLPQNCPKCNSPYWNKDYSRADKVEWGHEDDPLNPGEIELDTDDIINWNKGKKL